MFKNHVCWKPDMLKTVLGNDATTPPDEFFLAVHQKVPMYKENATIGDSRQRFDEDAFLADFRDPKHDFRLVPVIGHSGAGKSHLIRWLSVQIKSDAKRRVVFVPRLRTNLRDIMLMILKDLDDPRFEAYRERLRSTASNLSERQMREHLLNNLAVEAGPEGLHDGRTLDRIQAYLASKDGLTQILYDGLFREHLLRDGGVIDQLVDHTLGIGTSEITEEHREFTTEDLPLNVTNLAQAGAKARQCAAALMKPENAQAAVRWLNDHLPAAITRVLNMGREDMKRLMIDVRECLAEQGVELVLLIEDLVKFQGVESELLDVIIAPPQQSSEKPLCHIRTALGCTSGYFKEKVYETVRTRVNYIVDLEVGDVGRSSDAGAPPMVTREYLHAFVAQYLNTARSTQEVVKAWALAGGEEGDRPPSACNDCEHRATCHATFGAVNGVGLYPFTTTALDRMAERATPHGFRPRLIIQNVIGQVLDYHESDLASGRFPPETLRHHFGVKEINPDIQAAINDGGGSPNRGRWLSLIEFWTDGGKAGNLAPALHDAFDLPPLVGAKIGQATLQKTMGTGPLPPPKLEQAAGYPPEVKARLEELNRWQGKHLMGQDLAGELRGLIFKALEERIEWDSELLLKTHFMGTGKIFPKSAIKFRNMANPGSIAGFALLLPLEDTEEDLLQSNLAFRAMIRHSHHKSWNYDGGMKDFLQYAKMIDRWAERLLAALRSPHRGAEPWSPVPAAAELLALAGAIDGASTGSVEAIMAGMFKAPGPVDPDRSPAWQKLVAVFTKATGTKSSHGALVELLHARTPCTKGTSSSIQVHDASQFAGAIATLQKSWTPCEPIPTDLRAEVDVIAKVRTQVDAFLAPAIEAERQRYLDVWNMLLGAIGEPGSADEKAFLDAIVPDADTVYNAGVWAGPNRDLLLDAHKNYKKAAVNAFADDMRRLTNASPEQVFKIVRNDHSKAVRAITQFVEFATKFITASTERAQKEIGSLSAGGESQATFDGIVSELTRLEALVAEVIGKEQAHVAGPA